MLIEFKPALPAQADVLSDLAITSKGYWGYSKAQLNIWRKDLRVEADYISHHVVQTILVDGELVGFFAIKNDDDACLLDHFWLLPKAIGRGIGKSAFEEIKAICRELKRDRFQLVSDPDAEGFYLKQGCYRIGKVESKPQNRMLPKLEFRLSGLAERLG